MDKELKELLHDVESLRKSLQDVASELQMLQIIQCNIKQKINQLIDKQND